MKKLLLLIISIIITALVIVPMFLDWSEEEKQLITTLEKTLDKKISSSDKMVVSWFPLPNATISNVTFSDSKSENTTQRPDALIDSLTINLSISGLLSGHFKASSIIAHNAKIYLDYYDTTSSNWQPPINTSEAIPLQSVHFQNSSFFFQHHEQRLAFELDHMNLDFSINSDTQELLVRGSLNHGEVMLNVNASTSLHPNASQAHKSILQCESNLFSMSFNGDIIFNDAQAPTVTGTLKAHSDNPHGWASFYVDALSPILPYLTIHERLDMQGDLTINHENFAWQSIQITSPNIKGEAHMDLLTEDQLALKIEVTLNSLTLDPLIATSSENIEKTQSSATNSFFNHAKETDNTNEKNFTWSQPLKTDFLLHINELSYKNQLVKNSHIALSFGGGTLEIAPSFLLLPHDVRIQFNGQMTRNEYRPIFEGDVYLYGNKLGKLIEWVGMDNEIIHKESLDYFNISTHLTATPSYLSLTDIHASIDNAQLSGYTKIRFADHYKIDMSFDISQLDIDNMLNVEALKTTLYSEDSNNATAHPSLFSFISNQPHQWFIDVQGEKIKFNQHDFQQLQFLCTFKPGLFTIDGLKFDSKTTSLLVKTDINTQSLIPTITMSMTGDKLDLRTFSTLLPFNLEDIAATSPSLYKNEKSDTIIPEDALPKDAEDEAPSSPSLWPNKPFNLPKLSKWNGSFDASINTIYTTSDTPSFQDFNFDLTSKDGALTINKLQGTWHDGIFDIKGLATINPLSFNASFGLSTIPYEDMKLPYVPQLPMKGFISISGSLGFQGRSPQEIAQELRLKASIAGRNLTFQNFNLPSIIDRVSNKDRSYDAGNFELLLNNAIRSGSTDFTTIDGQINVQKNILTLQNTTFTTKRASGVIGGGLNILNYTMNLSSRIAFIPQYNAPALNLGMKLTGSLFNPVINLNADELVNYLNAIQPAEPVAPPATSPYGEQYTNPFGYAPAP